MAKPELLIGRISKMKKLMLILVCAVFTALSFAQGRTITVNGTCSLSIAPDTVKFLIDIETIDKDLKQAKQKNDKVFSELLGSLKSLGASEKDIRLSGMQYSKNQEYVERKYVHKGYVARQNITVTLKKLDLFEQYLTCFVQNNDIKFSTAFENSGISNTKEKALLDALKAAKKKAEKMANVYKMSIGFPIEIVEQASSFVRVANYSRSSGENSVSRSKMLNKIQVKATVNVKFELR